MFGYVVMFVDHDNPEELKIKVFDNKDAAIACRDHFAGSMMERIRIETRFRSVFKKDE